MDISVVIPLLNEEESLQELHDWIAKVMQSNRFIYEIIFIDDGSTDTSWQVIEQLSKDKELARDDYDKMWYSRLIEELKWVLENDKID